jgi:hypothetical protein
VKEPYVSLPQNVNLLPGAHPSSEGKRKRNRSNVEAMASKSIEPDMKTNGFDNKTVNMGNSSGKTSLIFFLRSSNLKSTIYINGLTDCRFGDNFVLLGD